MNTTLDDFDRETYGFVVCREEVCERDDVHPTHPEDFQVPEKRKRGRPRGAYKKSVIRTADGDLRIVPRQKAAPLAPRPGPAGGGRWCPLCDGKGWQLNACNACIGCMGHGAVSKVVYDHIKSKYPQDS